MGTQNFFLCPTLLTKQKISLSISLPSLKLLEIDLSLDDRLSFKGLFSCTNVGRIDWCRDLMSMYAHIYRYRPYR